MSSRDLAKFTDVRRYATLVCIITEARATLTDEVIDLHERILGSLFSSAKRTQAERLQQTGKLIQSKLKQYVTVGQALLNARESGEDPWTAIEDVLPWQEFINSVEETRFLSRKGNFDPLHLITEKYSTLRKYAPRMLSALQFMATPAAQTLSDALDTITEMYRKQLRKVPPSAPTRFIPESWRKLVLTPSGIDRKYYEFCVLNELKGALRSGDIWVKGSRRYKNFDDYLIPTAEFEKSRHNDQLQLAVQTDCQAYLQARMTLLASRLEEVNAMALAGDLPDVDISDKGVKITPLENSVPSGVSPFADLVYGMLPHPKITEILEEVDSWTGFMLDWFRDPGLRQRVQAGLNKGEARNALARAVFMHRLGEVRDRGLENQSYRASGLTLLTAAITLWNTVYIERAIESLKRKGISINEQLVSHLSPLGWEHINLSGDYVWRNNLKLGSGKYRSLRTVETALYKKQS